MKTSMKWLSILLVLCLLVAGIMAITTFAETESALAAEAEKDGIRVSLKINEEDYEKTGKMSLKLDVANDGDKKLKDIKTSVTMPESLLVKEGELVKDVEKMNYHALLQNEIQFAHVDSPIIVEDPTDPDGPGGNQGGNKGGLPSWVLPVALIAVAVIVAGVLIFLIATGKLKKGKNLSLLLLIGILVFSLAPVVNATEGEEAAADAGNTLTVAKEVTIEGETVVISATVTWDYQDPNPDNSTLTRADMEKAIAEMAFTWYFKGGSYEYDSASLNSMEQHLSTPLCGYSGGKSRLTAFPVMENATSHSSVFTVCSGFAYDSYMAALGYPILGSKFNCLTMTLWRNTSYPDDMAILRWHTKGQGVKYNNYDTTYNVKYNNWYSTKGVYDFFKNWKETMRPGDIIVFDNPGHAILYVGNGIVLDAGGGKYSMDTGTDQRETSGTVKFTTMEDYFFDPDNKNFDVGALGWRENSIVVCRPLDLLTIDDGDNDPGNDKINTNYKLRTGLLKYQLPHDKTHTVKTSDYGFDDITYTRLENMGMTINRTVSITPYGTATQGNTLTYSVTVANNSDNMDYLTYLERGGITDYEGVDYKDLWVVEHIPEGTELESVFGAIVDGNTLRWNADIPAGESRTFAYTVRVTGDVGDTIVSTGGWVNNIPSNTIENRIGGKQLPNKVKGNMTRFFEAGRDAWNSNDGYKISANVNSGTHFAEQVYQATTGLNLQLPDVQEIMDIFFSEYKYYTPYGTYLYHDSTGITRHMYRLNSKAPSAKDQIYYDMLVPGYYGGLWCYSDEYNGEVRINELREEYLEPGDIFIYLDLTEAEEDGAVYKKREVTGYTVMVYLGNSSYASLNSEGRLDPIDTAFGVTSAFMHDLFVCLRPRQAYTDINTQIPAFVGPAPDLTEADMRQTYKPNPSLILLNDVACKQFADMSIEDFEWIKVNGVFPGEVYSKLGMDIVTNGTDDASFATLLKYLFLDVEDETSIFREFGHHYFKLEEPKYGAEKWNDMLMYYAGPAIDDSTEVKITSMKDLHPGDIVMIGSRTSRFYVTTVYQGNGNFLLNVQSLQLSGIESKIWGELHFKNDTEFNNWLNSKIAPFAETLDRRDSFDPNNRFVKDLRYECYLVLRPSRAFENINEMVKRNIKDGALTTAEKNVLAKLTIEDFKNGPKKLFNINAVGPWAYGKAGVNVSIYLGSNSIFATRNLIFKWVGSYMELRMSYEDEYNNDYRTMLVPESYGGTAFNSSFIITPDMLQVGDLFCGAQKATVNGKDSTRYVVGIYQGNGKFLFIENGGAKGNIASYDTKSVFSKNIGKEWSYYYILRPDRIATVKKVVDTPPVYPEFPADPTLRFIDAYKLAPWETEAIANLTFDNWSTNCASYQLTNILPWVYKQAGIDIAMDKYGYQALTWAGANDSANTKGSYYNKILVSGSRGSNVKGSGIKNSQIGDIFGGRVVVKGKDGADVNLYYGAVYQGDGKWMAFYDTYSAGEKGHETKILSVEDLDAITWNFRYVLRPQQLASKEPPAEKPVVPGPRDITTGKLTDREKTSLSILTPTNIAYPSKHLYGTLPEYYKAVGIIVDMKNKTHEGAREQLFAKDGSTLVLRTEATDDTMAYFQAMNIGVYGGSMFAKDNQIKISTAVSEGKLQIGDVIAGYYVDDCGGTKTNTPFTALYQGNNKFLVVYPQWDGSKQSLVKAQVSARQIEVLDFLYYYTLRPENLNDIAVPSEPRDITTGKLTDAEKDALSKLTGSDIGYPTRMLYGTLPEYYKAANITVTMAGTKMTQEGIRNQLFNLVDSVLIPRTEATDDIMRFYQKMNIGVQGGSLFAEADRVSISGAITNGKLQIGDVIAGSHTTTYTVEGVETTKDQYITAMYQGNDTFLVYYYAYDAAQGKDAMNKVTWTTAQMEALSYKYYYTLRPENLAEAETPEEPAGPRDIADSLLTDAEKDALSKLTGSDIGYTSRNIYGTISDYYKAVNITLTLPLDTDGKTMTQERVRNKLFTWGTNPKVLIPVEATDDLMRYFQKMQVAVQGGSYFAEASRVTIASAVANNTLQIGDVIAGMHVNAYNDGAEKTETVPLTALYQGGNKFLVYYFVYDVAQAKQVMTKVTWTAEQVDALNFQYYYTLRPENLAKADTPVEPPVEPEEPEDDKTSVIRDISEHKLTTTEMDVLSKLTAEDMTGLGSVHLHTTIPTAYLKANINLNGHSKTASGSFGLLFSKISGTDYYAPSTASTDEVTKYFQTMLTDCYGGQRFETSKKLSESDLQIGDVFVGYIKYTAGNRYWSGIYQGDGNFLMFYSNEANQFKIEVLKVSDIENTNTYDFVFYFVLRPENLATEAAPDVRVVTWLNEDGTVLEKNLNAKVGSTPKYYGAEPTKAATATATYTFAGWTPAIAPVSGDVTYTATFTEIPATYTVIWKNEDGTELEKDENVAYGATPTYDGAEPTKAATEQFTYTFAGWTPEVSAVTGDVTYTATFTEVPVTFTIIWKNEDGTELEKDENVAYGTMPTYDGQVPTKAASGTTVYTFAGWTPEIVAATGDAVYTATFSDAPVNYTVIWKNEDGTELEKDENVQPGTMPTYNGEEPTKAPTATASYTFAGWTPEISPVSGDVIYTATFTEVPVTFTVIWKNADGSTLETDTVPYGTVPTYDGATPAKEADRYTYTFAGWDVEPVAVTGDAVYTATYTYSRKLTAATLSNEEIALLAGITTDDVTAAGLKGDNFSNVAPWIYQQAHIDGSTELNINIYALAGKFFTLKSGRWTPNTTVAAPYTDMLVLNAFGGTQMNNVPTFDINLLQVGDIFCGAFDKAQTGATSTAYAVYLYQGKDENGEGNFLQVAKTGSEVIGYTQLLAKTYANGENNYNWSYFFVIRPERYDSSMRDIALKPLTDVEMNTLAALVPGNIKGLSSGHLRGFVPHLYKLAGINLDLKDQTGSGAYGQLFEKISGTSYYIPKEASTDETIKYFQTMFTGIYGGSDFETSTKLSTVELQVGDVFVGVNKCPSANRNWSGVYQDNGNFLMYYWDDANKGHTEIVNISTLEDANSCDFKFYFILRPENLAIEMYTVTWKNDDGTVLETDANVIKDTVPTYNGAEPTKAPTAQYSYTFAGWTPAVESVSGDVVYTATFTESLNSYTVTWKNDDGTELEKDENVAYGATPSYDGAEPTKPSTAEKNYIFSGWTPEISAVSGDVTYTATFAEVGATYTIIWQNDDGTELEKDENVAYGATPTYDGEAPTKAADTQYTYTFAGWTPAISAVTGNMTYVASYDAVPNTFTVIWVNEDGTELEKDEAVPYGTTPTYDGEAPVKANPATGYTYTFAGWDKEVAAITGDTTYTATYSYVRTLTAHKLTNEELAVLAGLTPEDVKASLPGNNLDSGAPWAYAQAHIDASVFKITVHSLRNTILYSKGVYPPSNSKYSAEFGPTLVTNSHGGTQMTDNPPTFDMNYLQVGDLFCSSFFGSTDGNHYYVFLYQGKGENGEGKFLRLHKTDAAVYTLEQILAMTDDFAGVQQGWTYRYVIRPEDYNSATRDIALRELTDAEKYRLSQLTVSQVPMGSVHLHTTLPRYFQKVGIAMTLPLNASGKTITHDGSVSQLFKNSNGYYVIKPATDDTMRYFQKMLMDCQGGDKFAADKQVTMTNAIAGNKLQIGDVIVGKYKDADFSNAVSSFTALYQGGNNFLVQYLNWDANTGAQAYKTVVLTASQIDALAFSYYFTLRPSNLGK